MVPSLMHLSRTVDEVLPATMLQPWASQLKSNARMPRFCRQRWHHALSRTDWPLMLWPWPEIADCPERLIRLLSCSHSTPLGALTAPTRCLTPVSHDRSEAATKHCKISVNDAKDYNHSAREKRQAMRRSLMACWPTLSNVPTTTYASWSAAFIGPAERYFLWATAMLVVIAFYALSMSLMVQVQKYCDNKISIGWFISVWIINGLLNVGLLGTSKML